MCFQLRGQEEAMVSGSSLRVGLPSQRRRGAGAAVMIVGVFIVSCSAAMVAAAVTVGRGDFSAFVDVSWFSLRRVRQRLSLRPLVRLKRGC
jgi:hypothetical protein